LLSNEQKAPGKTVAFFYV